MQMSHIRTICSFVEKKNKSQKKSKIKKSLKLINDEKTSEKRGSSEVIQPCDCAV